MQDNVACRGRFAAALPRFHHGQTRTMLRIATLLLIACLLPVGAAAADRPFPAVDLPPMVPESIRDRTARELAATRDRLGWTVHPLRGEFHGLGTPAGGSSYANDLSANGRVVVGHERVGNDNDEAFVWSPWTGRANYEMTPNIARSTLATSISGDGVYVAGNALSIGETFNNDTAFRWSLAARESIVSEDYPRTNAAATSYDGRVTVGTAAYGRPWFNVARSDLAADAAYFLSELPDNDGAYPQRPTLQAYRYSGSDDFELLETLPGYIDSEGIDITADGKRTLVNAVRKISTSFYTSSSATPFIWESDGTVQSLGQANRSSIPEAVNRVAGTTATAISADGNTVVGNVTNDYSRWTRPDFRYRTTEAVVWREEAGWTSLRDDSQTRADEIDDSTEAIDVSHDGSLVIGNRYVAVQSQVIANIGVISFNNIVDVPFLWDEQRGMRDLADVLQLDYGLDLAGWNLGQATAISDDGTTIIGNGTNPDGDSEAWRAVLHRETPLGDIDFDGDIDHHDRQTLWDNLGLSSENRSIFYADGDLNADGLIDQQDVDTLLAVYEYRSRGDFDADGRVDLSDFTVWRDHTGTLGGIADANGNGITNAADLVAWRSNYGMTLGGALAQTVPEPTGLVLALLAGAATRRRARPALS